MHSWPGRCRIRAHDHRPSPRSTYRGSRPARRHCRGNFVSAIEEREKASSTYKAADYFAQLHGLGFDEIVSLAGRPTVTGYLDAVRQAREQLACESQGPPLITGSRAARRRDKNQCSPPRLEQYAAKEFATAVAAMNEGRYTDARTTLATIRVGRLNRYERSMSEQILYSLSEAEGDLGAAREHLLNALAARGLTADETRLVLARIRDLDARASEQAQ